MKVLFICTANIERSPTGEDIFKDEPRYEVKSAGTMIGYAVNPLTLELVDWADIIFCMEEHHRRKVLRLSPESRDKTFVLDIPDIYPRGHPQLVSLIKDGTQKILQKWG